MKAIFDARHRWGDPVRDGARITRVCRACGRSETYDTMVPDWFLDMAIADLARPNPYRSLFGLRT